MIAAPAPAVEIDHISKRYGRTLALDDVTFDVARGGVFALLGPNGAGKTTLLHILCTILRPDGGTARIGGVDVMKDPLGARRSLGVVFQEPSLDDRLTVACGSGAVRLVEVQRAGGRPAAAQEFLRGAKLEKGMKFS